MAITVIKLGGSVLRDIDAYRRYAAHLAARRRDAPDDRLVVVVSALHGETDRLLAVAQALAGEPRQDLLDLLWSTGELRSAATLALCLQAEGVVAAALDVHQAGIELGPAGARVRPRSIRRALRDHDVVVVPGFLGVGKAGAVVTLGRGGSDLTAVMLAAALDAESCELVKDVPGYFTADPNRDPSAEHVPGLDYGDALIMAGAGCDLVQHAALAAAAHVSLPLVITAVGDSRRTIVSGENHAFRHAYDSRRPAVGA